MSMLYLLCLMSNIKYTAYSFLYSQLCSSCQRLTRCRALQNKLSVFKFSAPKTCFTQGNSLYEAEPINKNACHASINQCTPLNSDCSSLEQKKEALCTFWCNLLLDLQMSANSTECFLCAAKICQNVCGEFYFYLQETTIYSHFCPLEEMIQGKQGFTSDSFLRALRFIGMYSSFHPLNPF